MTELVAWLWQGTVVALAAAMLLKAVSPQAAGQRYAIWWLALLLVSLHPVTAAFWSLAVPTDANGASPGVATFTSVAVPHAAWRVNGPPDWILAAGALAWLAIAAAGLARTVAGLTAMRRLVRSATPFGSREQRLPRWMQARARGRRPELRISDHVSSACAVGLLRPSILVAPDLAANLDDERLELIVLHEAAHLERYDDWARLAQRLLLAATGFHPGVRWLSRRLDCEMEAACDQRVVRCTGDALGYARCLLDVAAMATGRDRSRGLAPAVASGMPLLADRIHRLAASGGHAAATSARRLPLACAAALLVAVVALHAAPVGIAVEMIDRLPRVAPAVLRQVPLLGAVEATRSPVRAAAAAATAADTRPGVRARAVRGEESFASATGAAAPGGIVASGLSGTGAARRTVIRSDMREELPEDVRARAPALADLPAGRALTDAASGWSSTGAALSAPFTRSAEGVTRAAQSTGGAFSRLGRAVASAF